MTLRKQLAEEYRHIRYHWLRDLGWPQICKRLCISRQLGVLPLVQLLNGVVFDVELGSFDLFTESHKLMQCLGVACNEVLLLPLLHTQERCGVFSNVSRVREMDWVIAGAGDAGGIVLDVHEKGDGTVVRWDVGSGVLEEEAIEYTGPFERRLVEQIKLLEP